MMINRVPGLARLTNSVVTGPVPAPSSTMHLASLKSMVIMCDRTGRSIFLERYLLRQNGMRQFNSNFEGSSRQRAKGRPKSED